MQKTLNFSSVKPGDELYAINEGVKVYSLIIDSVEELTAFGQVTGYNMFFRFFNDPELYYFYVDMRRAKDKNVNVKLCKIIYAKSYGEYNPNMPYYLIGLDRKKLITYYISKLHESIDYQRTVIDKGIKKIEQLQDTIVAFQELL